ncbi:hypothetical protein [Mycolicibacterium conceptionense]|uniref:Uncharacterized protein n=1 Tax=Mycolicibacterium conceptionense TaxID=451644 RepID=A0A1A1X7B2_9MYCO|nr:hypothetical protein [Mycolicibacterium conceptionense]OBF15029.1 hypothetical protein A5726_22890 [Mycolicibacterium conceptionense]OBF30638.1 hypothetical protein A5720_29795 [Mycolicibacterium conceptionense]OBH94985.1 hypothetical protein A5716_23495 [Mycolicibacterium conceptionense]
MSNANRIAGLALDAWEKGEPWQGYLAGLSYEDLHEVAVLFGSALRRLRGKQPEPRTDGLLTRLDDRWPDGFTETTCSKCGEKVYRSDNYAYDGYLKWHPECEPTEAEHQQRRWQAVERSLEVTRTIREELGWSLDDD